MSKVVEKCPDAKRDGKRLASFAARLLLAAGEPVMGAAIAEVARAAPRSEGQAYAPGGLGRCTGPLIVAEGGGDDEEFMPLVDFFLSEVPGWNRHRRVSAEEAMDAVLGL
jgi:hypothetical protein